MDKNKLKDHKQIGQELELFFSHDIAPGAPFWLPKGIVIFKELEKYIRKLTLDAGYQETSTPIMVKSEIFKQSGHFEKFGEHNMYNLVLSEEEDDTKPVRYTLKPMNCPESTIIYNFRPRSYRELPLRLSELGRLHRREKSGEVNGLLRVRQITMDDAHLFVREDQILEEVIKILDTMIEFYKSFGFEYQFYFATRPENFAGTVENWTKAEKDLKEALESKKLEYKLKEGEGAFYGPKIDMHIKDAQGRDWQLATVQLDFHMPQAFDLKYIDEKGQPQKPVMIHRAIFGSFERFIAILTEHFQGAFSTWLSPIQVQIIPIADRHQKYAQKVLEQLKSSEIRVEVDNRAETMQAKIRDAQTQKIPYMIIVGDREEKENKVAIRERSGKDLGTVSLEDFLKSLKSTIESKV
ncbi:threonine--tRNA ligase [Patescibacteria group bacterium]|nr:threonine--tRNA ligase [Patescibacteria group bacterium]